MRVSKQGRNRSPSFETRSFGSLLSEVDGRTGCVKRAHYCSPPPDCWLRSRPRRGAAGLSQSPDPPDHPVPGRRQQRHRPAAPSRNNGRPLASKQ